MGSLRVVSSNAVRPVRRSRSFWVEPGQVIRPCAGLVFQPLVEYRADDGFDLRISFTGWYFRSPLLALGVWLDFSRQAGFRFRLVAAEVLRSGRVGRLRLDFDVTDPVLFSKFN